MAELLLPNHGNHKLPCMITNILPTLYQRTRHCVLQADLYVKMEVSVKNKFFTHEFVPAASDSQVTARYGYFYGK